MILFLSIYTFSQQACSVKTHGKTNRKILKENSKMFEKHNSSTNLKSEHRDANCIWQLSIKFQRSEVNRIQQKLPLHWILTLNREDFILTFCMSLCWCSFHSSVPYDPPYSSLWVQSRCRPPDSADGRGWFASFSSLVWFKRGCRIKKYWEKGEKSC